MPELPEVETVRRTLKPALGAMLGEVWTSGKALRLGASIPKRGLNKLAGARLEAIRRHGKYLLLDFSNGWSILVHLGMSGRLRLHRAGDANAPHTHVVWSLDRNRELRYSDPRRFGQVELVTRERARDHRSLAKLGPDPIEHPASWTGERLYQKARGRKASLKALLLDQSVVAGVGNIYASEALWIAKIRPAAQARTLSRARADALAHAVTEVLAHALDHGGTSLRDYVNADGEAGEHANHLNVYGRDGEPCRRCGTMIRRTVLQGRATYHCPKCQSR